MIARGTRRAEEVTGDVKSSATRKSCNAKNACATENAMAVVAVDDVVDNESSVMSVMMMMVLMKDNGKSGRGRVFSLSRWRGGRGKEGLRRWTKRFLFAR